MSNLTDVLESSGYTQEESGNWRIGSESHYAELMREGDLMVLRTVSTVCATKTDLSALHMESVYKRIRNAGSWANQTEVAG